MYKIHILDNMGDVERVFVFCANLRSSEHMNDLFSEIEIAHHKAHNVEVVFSTRLIHTDDTIRTIKHKIVNELLENGGLDKLSVEELYLFSTSKKDVDMQKLFQKITNDDTRPLSKEQFFQYATNISSDPYVIADQLKRDEFNYTQWTSIAKSGQRDVFTPIGMKFQDNYDFMFPANPYKNQLWSESIRYEFDVKNPLLTMDKSLLLEYTQSKDIMVCLAKNVFEYTNTREIQPDHFCGMYYPYLYKSGITSGSLLRDASDDLSDATKTQYTPQMQRRNEVTQLYREIQMNLKEGSELNYTEIGVKTYSFTLPPLDFGVKIPLDYLFRNIHSTKQIPFIKYNPGNRRENTYRMYSPTISSDGKKIPVLTESKIMKLSREIGKGKQIVLYINDEIELFIQIHSNSEIVISGELQQLKTISDLDTTLVKVVQPILSEINNILYSSGYSLRKFHSVKDDNIIHTKLDYRFSIPLETNISFTKQLSYITPIFNVTKMDIKKGAVMRFKRVGNYKEMDAKTNVIRDVYNETGSSEDVIQALVANFNISEKDAIIEFGNFRSQFQLLNRHIVDSPGFLTTFTMKPLKNELLVEITDVSSVEYITELTIYIDTILRMTQNPKSVNISKDKLLVFKTNTVGVAMDNEDDGVETMIAHNETQTEVYKPLSYDDVKDDVSVSPVRGLEFDDEYYDSGDENSASDNESAEVESEEDEEYHGGSDGDSDEDNDAYNIELDGTPIKNPTPFYKKMLESDSALFVTEETSKFPLYSKTCPSSDKRQPIVLTDEEKQHIDKTNPGSYGRALRHGSSPDKKHWYICPRYWCLKTNSSISEEDVNAGKCGAVIPRGADRVPKGAYVYEFNRPAVHIKDGKYVQHTPGFIKQDKHPGGLCAPCCFSKSWDSKDQMKRRESCGYDEEGASKTDKTPSSVVAEIPHKSVSYIISSTSNPLPIRRWGFIPVPIQLFLNTDTSLSVDPKNPAIILPNKPCLLRYGIENSDKQSFIACFAYFYAYKHKLVDVPSISDMKDILSDKQVITLDMFTQYHNGNLVSIFKPKDFTQWSIDITLYSNTRFYKTIRLEDETQLDHLENTIASYENFLKYILDEKSEINHVHLWDFFCERNTQLLRDGMNLIILQLSDDDITEKVQMICPSNAYSHVEYDSRKETAIIIKQGSYYEPIHLYERNDTIVVSKTDKMSYELKMGENLVGMTVVNGNNKSVYKLKKGETRKTDVNIKKAFLEHTALTDIKDMLKLIKTTTRKYCAPLPSAPKKYTFKMNIPITDIIRILKGKHFQIKSQVLNYRNKTIGVCVYKDNEQNSIFIPCFPSAIVTDLNTQFMDDVELWLDYRQTRDRLVEVSRETNGKVFCLPKIKVIDDELVIGFLTETNQFVQINPPTQNIDNDGISEIKHSSYQYEKADKTMTITDNASSTEHDSVIQNIHLETQFYNIFRTLTRIQLNDYDNRMIRKEMIDSIDDASTSYHNKLNVVIQKLHDLLDTQVVFETMDEKGLLDVKSVVMCNKTTCDDTVYCLSTDDGGCKSVFPKEHLIAGGDNETIYYARMGDELIRYNRTRLFMFQPKTYMNITNSELQTYDDELFLLESKLTRDYFRNLVPYSSSSNHNSHNISFDNAQPDQESENAVQKYSNVLKIQEQQEILDKTTEEDIADNVGLQDYIMDCIEYTKPHVVGNTKSGSWRTVFPATAKELFFQKTVTCSFIPLIYVFQEVYLSSISVQNIKTALWRGYSELFKLDQMQSKIISILRNQGKRELTDSIKYDVNKFEKMIFSDEYYITDLDWWVFCSTARLPVIMFSSTNLKYLIPTIDWVRLGGRGSKNEKHFFVRSSVNMKMNIPQGYHVVQDGYAFSELKSDIFVLAERGDTKYTANLQTIQEYLEKSTFVKRSGKK